MSNTTIEHVDQKFRSGNGVPVERAMVTAEEWDGIKKELDILLHAAKESQGWDWLDEYSVVEERDLDYLTIDEMQRLLDIVQSYKYSKDFNRIFPTEGTSS